MSHLSVPMAAPADHSAHSSHHEGEHTGHIVQFYSEDAFLLDELTKFASNALLARDAVVIIATAEHRDNLAHHLARRSVDLDRAVSEGRYIALDAADTLSTFMRLGQPDPDAFASAIGPVIARAAAASRSPASHVAAFGEMVALLWNRGQFDAAIKLEQLWNDLARRYSFALCCAYPLAGFRSESHAEAFLKICAEHSAVIPGETYTSLGTEQQRLRNVAELQQKALALDTEKALLLALRNAKQELEKEVSDRREAQRKLHLSELSLRQLSVNLLRTQDEERRRLGRELHDTLGQYLAVLKMGLDSLHSRGVLQDEASSKQMADCLSLVEQSIRELRTTSYLLYPPMLEEMGLKTAVSWYVDGFSKRSGIDVQIDICPTLGRLPRELELTLFRVLQESLTNVHRHSGSSTARVCLRLRDGFLHLEIEDSGKGLPPSVLDASPDAVANRGVGLRGMKERLHHLGGTLTLISDRGTTIRASLPCALDGRSA